jgi:Kef-type K+ transport system membrane component KefB
MFINSQAGIIVGNTVLLKNTKFSERSGGIVKYFDNLVLTTRFVFMFLIGLEVDIIYLRQNIRRCGSIAFASIAACILLVLVASPLLYHYLALDGANMPLFIITIGLFLSNSASPVLICIVTEMKLVSSKIGKLAISSAVINDLTAVVGYVLYAMEYERSDGIIKNPSGRLLDLLAWAIVVALIMLIMKWLVKFVNVWNRKKRCTQTLLELLNSFFKKYILYVWLVEEQNKTNMQERYS